MSEYQYLNLLRTILNHGDQRIDRTYVGTLAAFGPQMIFDLSDGTFPLLTTKKMFWKGIVAELLWMLSGDTNVKTLQAQGVHIWDEWAGPDGELGPVYGDQWRRWNQHTSGLDQMQELVDGLKREPFGRRHIVTAWNPDDVRFQKLPPCHCFFQCFVSSNKRLSLILHQRSADMFLGVPFNIASYSLLLLMLAQVTGLRPGTFIHNLGDAHIYSNHVPAVLTQLRRTPLSPPKVTLDSSIDNLFDFDHTHITLEGYQHHDPIKASVAV